METIIHIGQHKTGTTSIQKFLFEKRDELLKEGVYIPINVGGYENISHFVLNVYSLNEERFSSMKRQLIETGVSLNELSTKLKEDIKQTYVDAAKHNCHKVIWTNEGLYLLNTVEEYKRLVDLFQGYSTEIEVVCCFRDVDSYRRSYIKQLEKEGTAASSNPDSYRYVESDSWLFDYKRKKELLSRVFDKSKFFDYESSDNVVKFFETIEVNISSANHYRVNVTKDREIRLFERLKGFFNRT